MNATTPNNPLHGITLEKILTELEANLGWARMGEEVTIKCFTNNPTIKSSLVFLRRTPWARAKVEKMYLDFISGRTGYEMRQKRKTKERSEKEMYPDLEL